MTSEPYEPFISALRTLKTVLITTHVRPDGDALGTAAAVPLLLRLTAAPPAGAGAFNATLADTLCPPTTVF